MAPKLSSAALGCERHMRGDGTWVPSSQVIDSTTRLCTVTAPGRCRHVCALGGIVPRGRQLQRLASVEFFLSAPVLRPVSVPLFTKQFANSCATQLRFPGSLEWRVA